MLIKDKTDCCGCTACESVCAHKAITMQPDELGFLYPKIDFELCVDCGLCEKVCQFKKNYNRGDNYATPKVYAARHKKLNELAESQTGAAFFAFSEKILDEGGVVYGVIFAEDFHVVHSRTETKEKRDHMRTSKYVQSDIRGIFSLVKDDLRAGRTVLFTGTPCQVAGMLAATPPQLHKYLITIDLVCHAVPSPAVWESYIAWLQKKYQEKILIAKHRDKKIRLGIM